MSHTRSDEINEQLSNLRHNLETCEGMGWRDDERQNKIQSKITALEIELGEIRRKRGY